MNNSFTLDETNKIKGIAICMLVFHHMYRTVDDIAMIGATPFISAEYISRFAFCLRICVFIFAFLTAYGLSMKLVGEASHHPIRFILSRYIKLVMPYSFTLVMIWLFWIVVIHQSPLERYGNPLYMLADFFSVLELLGHTDKLFVGVFWYMNFAVVEILVLPYIVWICRRINWFILPATALLYNVLPSINSEYGGDYKWYIFAIELGVLFFQNNTFDAVSQFCSKLSKLQDVLLACLLLIFSFVFPYLAWFVIDTERFGIPYIFHTMGAICMILFSFCSVRASFIESLFIKFGKLSADIFLLHILIYETASIVISITGIIPVQYVTSLVLCYICSYILSVIKNKCGYSRLVSLVSNRVGRITVKEKS